MHTLSRKSHLAKKIVFVDGLPGCGKTLFSTLISSMDRVELLSYIYEVEHICALYHLDKMIQTDLKIYNTMMGRDVNFRQTDLSSAFNNHDPFRYLDRLSGPGDEKIPEMINQENPILNFAVHNTLSYSEPIWDALGERCVFIEIIRHPLYMVRQQSLNMQNLIEDVRDFTIYFDYKGLELPYYVSGWEKDYFIDKLTQRTKIARKRLKEKYQAKIITIPFEPFVLNPDSWLRKIGDALQTNSLDTTSKVMTEQNIPRGKVSDGLDLDIYRRCGWEPPKEGATERDELRVRREDVVSEIRNESIDVLDRLIDEYEKIYWRPDS